MRSIRAHHPDAHITLLTTPMLVNFAAASPYLDRVLADPRAPVWRIGQQWRLRRQLLAGQFERVYDLQNSERTRRYFQLWPRDRRPEWSGAVTGCSHPYLNPNRSRMHGLDRLAEQLQIAGIAPLAPIDLSWADTDLQTFNLPSDYAVLVPGAASHRIRKRWPAAHYAEVAAYLVAAGVHPVIVGTEADRAAAETIQNHVPQVHDLIGRTDLIGLAALSRRARLAIGNDTGPMHMLAAAGAAVLVLFSDDSDPDRNAPRGRSVQVIQEPNLANLAPETVCAALEPILATSS